MKPEAVVSWVKERTLGSVCAELEKAGREDLCIFYLQAMSQDHYHARIKICFSPTVKILSASKNSVRISSEPRRNVCVDMWSLADACTSEFPDLNILQGQI